MSNETQGFSVEQLGLYLIGRVSRCIAGELTEEEADRGLDEFHHYLRLLHRFSLPGPRTEELLKGLLRMALLYAKDQEMVALPAYIPRNFTCHRNLAWLRDQVQRSSHYTFAIIGDGRILIATAQVVRMVECLEIDQLLSLGKGVIDELALAGVPIQYLVGLKRGVSMDHADMTISGPYHRVGCKCSTCETNNALFAILSSETRPLGEQIIALSQTVSAVIDTGDQDALAVCEHMLDGYLEVGLLTDLVADHDEVCDAVCEAANIVFGLEGVWSPKWILFVKLKAGKDFLAQKARSMGWTIIEQNEGIFIYRHEERVSEDDFAGLLSKLRSASGQ